MNRSHSVRSLVALFSVMLPAALLAQAPSPSYPLQPETFELTDFRMASGVVVDRIVVEYATLGMPRRDSNGLISNAVINPHGWSGNYAQNAAAAKDLLGPGRPLDPARYFIIFPTALGSPGSSSPSTSRLGPAFPKYTVADMVHAQYRLVTEKFGIKRLAGVIGASMGGYQTLQWITQYPDMMNWAVPIAASQKAGGRMLGIFGMMSYSIRTDPTYMDGAYAEQPREGLRRGLMHTFLWNFGAPWYDEQFKTEAQAMKGLEDAGRDSERFDANDIIWRNDALAAFNVAAALPSVKARVLVVGIVEDELFPPRESIQPLADAIPGAKVHLFESRFGHLGCALDIGKANPAILSHIAAAEGR